MDIGYLVLDRDASIEFLRDRRLTFPAMELLLVQGIGEGPIHERTEHGLMTKSGPPHLRLRKLVAPAMSPRSINRLRQRLRADIEERWEKVGPDGRCEFVHAFAQPIP